MKRALVYGAVGSIGGYLVKKLKKGSIAQIYPWIESQVKKDQKEERNL